MIPQGRKVDRPTSKIKSFTSSGTTGILYTCPVNCRSKVVLVYIINAGPNVSINLKWYKASEAVSYFILGSKNMALGEFIQLSDSYIILEPGDRLEITPTGATPLVDAICTAEETFIPVG